MNKSDFITFSELYTADYDLIDIYAERQTWVDGALFRRDRPRKSNALIFLNGCTGVYTNQHGESFHADSKSLICLPYQSEYTVLNVTSGSDSPDAYLIEFNIVKEGRLLTFSDSPFLVQNSNSFYSKKLSETAVLEYEALPRSNAAVKAAIYSFLSYLGKEALNEYVKKFMWIAPAVEFMEENPFSSATVEELSKMCNVSSGAFRRMFKEYSGKSPARYKTDIKIEAAKKMLENSSTSIERISELLGYDGCAYFCRIFKKETGLTPGEYRKRY